MKEYIDKAALVEVMESLVNLAKLHVKSGKTESEIWKAIHMTQLEERQDILTLIQNLPNINNEIETVVRCQECTRKNTTACPAYDAPFMRTSLRIKFCSEGKPKTQS